MMFPDSPGMSGPASPGSAPPLESAVYALGNSPAERDRLRRQSEERRGLSTALLDRVGVERGWNAADLGCGPSGIIDLLAERVGPEGHVAGLDINPANVTLAREFADELGLVNADVAEADARRTGLPPSSFDLAHARTLLVTIPDPAVVVAEMARLVRPGGWVAAVEPDGGGSVCYPPHPAWDRLSLTTWCSIGFRASSGGVVVRLAGDARLPGGGAVGHERADRLDGLGQVLAPAGPALQGSPVLAVGDGVLDADPGR